MSALNADNLKPMRPALVEYLENKIGTGFFVPDGAFLIAIALVLGIYWIVRQAEEARENSRAVFRVCLITLVAGYLSARLYIVLQHWTYFAAHPAEIVRFWEHGTASFGAYSGGILAALLATRLNKLSTKSFLDWCAPAMALGIFLGRTACFLNGCCFGKPSLLPWAMPFPAGSGAYHAQLQANLIQPSPWSLPVHPTQLYEAVFALAVLGLLLRTKQHMRPGNLFLLVAFLYALGRFGNEFLRADARGGTWGLSLPQFFCVGAITIIICWSVLAMLKARRSQSG